MFWDALKWSYESAEHANLKAGPQAVLNALAYSMHPSTKACYPSITRLAALTHQAESTVERNLAILVKAGLVEINRAKTEHDTNGYILNYTTIPKKGKKGKNAAAAPDDMSANSAESSRTSAESSRTHTPDQSLNLRDSNLSIREGQPLKNDETNLSNRETNVHGINSVTFGDDEETSSISSREGDDVSSSSSRDLSAPPGFCDEHLIQRSVKKPSDCCGFNEALKVVDEAFPEWSQPSGNADGAGSDNLYRKEFAEALAFFPCPTVEDAKGIASLIKESDDWLALEQTRIAVRKQIDSHNPIYDMRKYFMDSLLRNIRNTSSRMAWKDKEIARKMAALDQDDYYWGR